MTKRTCARAGCDRALRRSARADRLYCSLRCRVAAYRGTAVLPVERICAGPGCDRRFAPVSRVHRYCSSRCRSRAARTVGNGFSGDHPVRPCDELVPRLLPVSQPIPGRVAA